MLDYAQFAAAGAALVDAQFAAAIAPDPRITVTEWADKHRYLATEASPRPGKWDTALTPYLAEVMDCLSPSHPCKRVPVKKAAQLGYTDGGINWMGAIADLYPGPMGVFQPTVDMAKAFVKTKLEPARRETPKLRQKVKEQKSRDTGGSTTFHKQFDGGYWHISGANSSAGLQMFSFKFLFKDELSEWPFDVDGRGDPSDLADTRTDAFREDCKIYEPSTPGIQGQCRISQRYEDSDQRRYHVPCPHCGAEQVLEWGRLIYAEAAPHGTAYQCAHCEEAIAHHHKAWMLQRGRWTAEEPGPGRQPGFAMNALYSPFLTWDDLVEKYLRAVDQPLKMKVFTQQVLGEAWEESGEAPGIDRLLERREVYPLGRVPAGGLLITMAVDVQGNRLEFATYAWGIGLTGWLIDRGIEMGDPADDQTWRRMDRVIERKYEDQWGGLWGVDAVGVDAGYLSSHVYRFAHRHAHSGRVYALDGQAGWGRPPIGTPKRKPVTRLRGKRGSVMLYPVGNFDMKSELYASLRKTIEGPDEDGRWPHGALHFPESCDQEFFQQLTAEHLADRQTRSGYLVKEWVKPGGRANEQHDLAVYARALAHMLSDRLDVTGWSNLAARRGAPPEDAQRDLAEVWNVQPQDIEDGRNRAESYGARLAKLNG